MIPEWSLIVAVILVSLTSLGLLISWDWRFGIAWLALQYLGVFLLVSPSWPVELAVTKMVAGWMAGAVLGAAITSSPDRAAKKASTGVAELVFRLLSAGVVALVLVSIVPDSAAWFLQINLASRWGGFILIGMGLLHLGFTNQPLRITLGLLTVLSGFEILYAALEASTLVAGLLAVINLGLASAGAYLLLVPHIEEKE
jgi:hypothetical protein